MQETAHSMLLLGPRFTLKTSLVRIPPLSDQMEPYNLTDNVNFQLQTLIRPRPPIQIEGRILRLPRISRNESLLDVVVIMKLHIFHPLML